MRGGVGVWVLVVFFVVFLVFFLLEVSREDSVKVRLQLLIHACS